MGKVPLTLDIFGSIDELLGTFDIDVASQLAAAGAAEFASYSPNPATYAIAIMAGGTAFGFAVGDLVGDISADKDSATITADALLVIGDAAIVVGAIALGAGGTLGKTIGLFCEWTGEFATVVGIAAKHYDTAQKFIATSPALGAFINQSDVALNQIQNLEISLTTFFSALSSSVSSAWSSTESYLSTSLTDMSKILSNFGSSSLDSIAASASNDFGNLQRSLTNLFGATGEVTQNVTETAAMGAVTVTQPATGSSVTIDNSAFENPGGATYDSNELSFSSPGTTFIASSTDVVNASGSATFSTALQSGADTGAQILQTTASGITSNQTVLDGITIIAPASLPSAISTDASGSLLFAALSPASGSDINVGSASDGSEQIDVANNTGSPQLVADYAPGGLAGATIDISNPGDITTDIGADGATIQTDNSVSGVTQDIQFGDPEDIFEINNPGSFTGTISNFLQGDTLDLLGIAASVTAAATLDASNVLTVFEASGSSATLQLDPMQSFGNVVFVTQPDGNGGTDVTLVTPVMATGTQVAIITGTNIDPHSGNPYSIGLTFTPDDIQFAPIRTDDPAPADAAFLANFIGGEINFNGGDAVVNQAFPNASVFYSPGGCSVGPENTSGTGYVALNPSALPSTVSGDFSGETLPLEADYEGGSITVDLTVGIKIYAPAIPEFLTDGAQTFDINIGIVHLGQPASMDVEISNVATGDLTDSLSGSPGTLGQFTAENGLSDIAAGDSGIVAVSMTGEIPGPVLVLDSRPLFDLASHDPDLPDEGMTLQNIPVLSAQVYNYADPVLDDSLSSSDGATLTQDGNNWALDLASVPLNSFQSDLANIEIENAAPTAYSDTLSGSASTSASPDGGFIQSIPGVSGLSAPGGAFLELGDFNLDSTSYGSHSETVVFDPLSIDTAGTTALPGITLTVTDNVELPNIAGASLTVQGTSVVAVAIEGLTAILDPLMVDATVNTLVIEGPGTAEFQGPAFVSILDVAPTGDLAMTGNLLAVNPITVEGDGEISGFGTIAGTIASDGTLDANGGILDINEDVNGGGTLTVDPGGTLFPEGTVAATEHVVFTGPNAILGLASSTNILAPISGLTGGDIIGLATAAVTSAIYNSASDTLTIAGSDGSTQVLNVSGSYQQSNFVIADNVVDVTCFVAGTRIATPGGEVLIENLSIGDLVQTKFAGPTPIKWIGYRHTDCSRHPDPRKVWPVRVTARAFAESMPQRDLWLSPDHAVFVNDVLVPIKHLVNNTTIKQTPKDEVTYYHIELDRHDVMFAEGLSAESYLDTGDRWKFTNRGSAVTLHPDFSARVWEANGCAPLIVTGSTLAAIHVRLLQRAARLANQRRPNIRTNRAA